MQPGVRNLAVSEAALPHGLFYAPDPSSQIACSIGGNVAENAGGVHCLKYGLTVHNVAAITLVTVDGEAIELGSDCLDCAGPDLLSLIVGSEGLLGIVTEVLLKLLPLPATTRVVLAGFDEVEAGADAVGEVIAHGIVPAGFEMMDSEAIVAAESYASAGYPVNAAALLLCELDGSTEDVAEQIAEVTKIFESFNATTVRVSQSEEERQLFWRGRKAAFPAMGRLSPDYYCMDGTIPRRELGRVLLGISSLSAKYGLRVANVFHAGDGNLHPLILFDASRPGELARTEALGHDILSLCIDAGGCITGEHGVGIEKLKQMTLQFSDAELQQLHAVRRAFDPNGLLNPGKGIPELKRCQEYRSTQSETTTAA